jgi:hypothetical protein
MAGPRGEFGDAEAVAALFLLVREQKTAREKITKATGDERRRLSKAMAKQRTAHDILFTAMLRSTSFTS